MNKHYWITGILVLFLTMGSSISLADLASMRARVPQIIALKDKGVIGEKLDGLLGVVKASSKAKSVVKAENKDRLSVYKKRAKKGGTSLPTFMKVMGEERIKKEKPGRFIQNAQGSWVKK